MEIFERILYLRKDYLKMTRKEFADKLGINESVIVNIELNRLKRPEQKEPIYRLICKIFDVNEEWLRSGIGKVRNERTKNEQILDFLSKISDLPDNDFQKRFINALSKLDLSEWQAIEKILDLMNNDE